MTLSQNAVIRTNKWSDSSSVMVVRSSLLINNGLRAHPGSRGRRFQGFLDLGDLSWLNS